MSSDSYAQVSGDGSMERFSDPFSGLTPEDAEAAASFHQAIIAAKSEVELGFAKLGFLLSEIKERHLYKALEFDSFDAYVQDASVEVSKRVAQDLIRIHRNVVPLLGDNAHGDIGKVGISKVRAMLPLLNIEDGEAKFVKLFEELRDSPTPMVWNDVRQEVKRLRGVEEPIDERQPVIFTVTVLDALQDSTHVRIEGSDGVAIERLGDLRVPTEWWANFQKGLGKTFEVVEPK